jgi:tRNA threonylcarbamoyladenosine modification (KEOPS) complex Cgi121 subunit
VIRKLEEFGKYIVIAGFRDAKIEDINAFFNLVRKKTADAEIQIFNADLIASWEHLYFAALNALKAFHGKLNISNSLAMETLLYASAQRQIDKAIDLLGKKPQCSKIAILIIAKTSKEAKSALENVSKLVSGEHDDSTLQLTDEKMAGIKRLFNISDVELESKLKRKGLEKETLVDLVIEHVALLVTQR